MKTIVIIENETVELETLVSLFEQWQKEINILTAAEEKAAIRIMTKQQVDLVVCDLAIPGSTSLDDFSLLTHTFPYVPCIALATGSEAEPEEVVKRGASHCLEKPIDSSLLLQHAGDLLDIATGGTVKGIPIHSFLQMLESDEKTCTLQVIHENDKGLLYIKDGILIGAETKNFLGEEAAYLILSWQETVLEIRYFNGQRKNHIRKPLISIIMEAFRLKSEREKHMGKLVQVNKHQLSLKHMSTLGKQIPFEIGSPVQIELPRSDDIFEAEMVGMLQEQYLIVTTPDTAPSLETLVGDEQRILVKYVLKGRVWMFKSQLLKSIEFPSGLLFFEYPGVIHFHELRKAKRTSIFIPSTFHVGSQPELFGALVDLSMTGALCQIKRKGKSSSPQFSMDYILTLRCLLPGIKEEQIISGRIKNMVFDDMEIRLGIEFIDLPPRVSDTMSRYLYPVADS